MRIEDPWHDSFASDRCDQAPPTSAGSGRIEADGRHSVEPPADERARAARVTGPQAAGTQLPSPAGESERERRAREAVYLTVQRSPAFRQVRSRYRGFALPAGAAFLLWYLSYVVAATSAPEVMARPIAGVFNVGMAAGLAQFATTFLLTWAYVRHATRRRDPLALELRWETQEMTRTAVRGGAR
ncbi:DUF485 domain-containing protein [Streptomyces xiaopingdaonensis]|uniref:DUF485 domain-containing protein n=1 Tax=Streptomyces xiaopingdaonensis TaxID=1565415 RepID=UPI000305CF48|nr:DUF485 domain-containing protein [Streptomyces xiaopingdaonensis]